MKKHSMLNDFVLGLIFLAGLASVQALAAPQRQQQADARVGEMPFNSEQALALCGDCLDANGFGNPNCQALSQSSLNEMNRQSAPAAHPANAQRRNPASFVNE